jgi:hypothetical protein
MRSSPALKRLVALDGVVTIVWLTSGIYIFLIPDAPSQLVISALLWVASVLVATATVLVVDDLPAQRRGCDIVNSCPCVRKLRRLLAPARRVGVLRFIDSRWDDKTEAGEISAWALSMTTVLLIVAAANVLPTLRAAIDDRGRTGHERTVARWRVRSILPTAPDFGAWTPAQVDEDVNHLVKAGFEVWQWGGTLLNLQGGALHFNVPEIIDDVTPCGAGLLVTFGAGRAALYSRRTGRPISRELQISSQPAQAVCRWRSAFFTVPRGVSENEGGYLLRARSSDLAVQAKIAIDGLLGGMVDTADTLIVGDLKRGTLVDIDIDRNYSRGPAADVPEPRTMLMAGSAVLVLEGERGCVRQISADGQRERRNAAVPAPLVAAALASDSLMVLADGGRIMQRLSVSTLRPLGPPLTLPDGVRGTDLLAVRGGWEVLSGPADLQLTVSTYDEQRMETTGPGADEIRELAPCR